MTIVFNWLNCSRVSNLNYVSECLLCLALEQWITCFTVSECIIKTQLMEQMICYWMFSALKRVSSGPQIDDATSAQCWGVPCVRDMVLYFLLWYKMLHCILSFIQSNRISIAFLYVKTFCVIRRNAYFEITSPGDTWEVCSKQKRDLARCKQISNFSFGSFLYFESSIASMTCISVAR